MIPNPTPITAATFAGLWIQSLQIMLPSDTQPRGLLRARLLPYDGAANLLAVGAKDVMRPLPSTEAPLTAMLATIITEVQRLAVTEREVRAIHVHAPDPAKPVSCTILFAEGSPHRVANCFALAATDATFAAVLAGTMNEIARLAGLA